jgi:hypothetical protein
LTRSSLGASASRTPRSTSATWPLTTNT